jgi:hypothetical protein
LVGIGSIVSEENFVLNFIPPFSIFSLVAILVRTSSCLEPVAQLEPNFDKIVIEWSFSKIVSGGPAL